MSPYPFQNTKLMQEVLQIFASRAASELERLQVEDILRENEEKCVQLADNINQHY